MIHTIYIEKEIIDHPKTIEICARFPTADKIICDRFTEIFNRKAQNFRLQKQRPALLLAKKYDHYVLEAPTGYGIGGAHNFYFSHMLNCLYDCRYCFLQGMYRSAHYVLFVNYEDFINAIQKKVDTLPNTNSYFFSGYNCDSLAFEPISKFADFFIKYFRTRPNIYLELRTKSTQIRTLLNQDPIQNCIIAFSFTPGQGISGIDLENRVPKFEKRIAAIVALQKAGWPIGLRFDPLVYHKDFSKTVRKFLNTIFTRISVDRLHSVSVGSFRLPPSYFKKMVNLYPDEPLFAGPLVTKKLTTKSTIKSITKESTKKCVTYKNEIEMAMKNEFSNRLLEYIPKGIYFPCSG